VSIQLPANALRAPLDLKVDDEKTERVLRDLRAQIKELQNFVRQLIEAS
jgi:hypothetical protein